MEDPCSILDRVKITISHERYSWLDNTSFFSSNCLKSIPKKIHMIPANGSNTGDGWMSEDICCIESPTKPYFNYGIFTLCITKIEKCSNGFCFKKCCLWLICKDLLKILSKFFMWNISFIRFNRLCNIYEIWRGEDSYLVSCFLKDCKSHLAH